MAFLKDVPQQTPPCLCGFACASLTTMKRHRKVCETWKARDPAAVKSARIAERLAQVSGPSIQRTKNCRFCGVPMRDAYKEFDSCQGCQSVNKLHSKTPDRNPAEFFLELWNLEIPGVNRIGTIEKFSYAPGILSPQSSKPVIQECEFCLSEFEAQFRKLSETPDRACKKCDAISASYSRHGRVGNKHEFWKARRLAPDESKLNVVATIEKFGYSPLEIATYSNQKVIAICDFCGKDTEMVKSKFTAKMESISCSEWVCRRRKTVRTLQKERGVDSTLKDPAVLEKLSNPSTERIVESILQNRYGIGFRRQLQVGPYSFDFFIPDLNLLIECQGDYFHDFKQHGYQGMPQDRAKASYIESNTNYKLVWIYEHEIHLGRLTKILDHHIYGVDENPMEFELSDLQFLPVSNKDAHAFLSIYHYLGNLGTVATSWGAFIGTELIAVAVFGGVTRNQSIAKINKFLGEESKLGPKDVRELRRFCIHPRAHKKNMASFVMKRIIDKYRHTLSVRAILSFSDPNVQDVGTIYKASNWQRMADTSASYHYVDSKTLKMIHKKVVWDQAKNAHLSEVDFARTTGLTRVEEIPKHAWLKIFKE